MAGGMTKEEAKTELARLRNLLAKREGKQGYKANVEAIKARIAEVEKAAA